MKKLTTLLITIIISIHGVNLSAASAYTVEFQDIQFDVFTLNANEQHSIRFFWKNPAGENYANFKNIKNYFTDHNQTLVFATNGGIFARDHSPLGLYIESGVQRKALIKRKGGGNFFLMPNGVFYVTDNGFGIATTAEYAKTVGNVTYATQSGPMLVINGELNPQFRDGSASLYVRSGVGIDQSGNAVFAISDSILNFYTFASMFKEKLHCDNALYLDGAISKMYLPQVGRKQLGGDFAVIIAVAR